MIDEEITQATEKFEPVNEFIIEDLDTLKVLADPLRLRILEMLAKPRTVKQIAANLDIAATKLYYHVNQLEQKELIVTVDTRIVSGIIEKRYQVAAKSFRVKRGLLSPTSEGGDDGLELTVTSLFDSTKAELLESSQAGIISIDDDDADDDSMNMFTGRFRLTHEQARDLHRKLNGLIKEFKELSDAPENETEQVYRMLLAWFPTSRPFPTDNDTEE